MRPIDADALLEYLMINMGWHDEDGREVDDWDEKREIITHRKTMYYVQPFRFGVFRSRIQSWLVLCGRRKAGR